AHDENNVALQSLPLGSELPKIDSADPVSRNANRSAGLPLAISHALIADGRIGLHLASVWPEAFHVAPPGSAIVAQPVDLDAESRRRVGANVHFQRLAIPQAGARAIPFDPGAAVLRRRVDAGVF